MSPPLPSHLQLRGALLTSLLLGAACPACNPGGAATVDSDATQTSGITVTTDTNTGPTTGPTTGSPTSSPTEDTSTGPGPCTDGQLRCLAGDDREACKGGVWVDDPCPDGQGCDPFGVCIGCMCAASQCLDADTLNVCNCTTFEQQDCGPTSACDALDGPPECHAKICNPDEVQCADSDTVVACNATGTAMLAPVDCPADQLCDFGVCEDACKVVAKNDSSVGCDFWAVDMANVPPRDAYVFAVALSNPSPTPPVKVRIYDRNNNGQEQGHRPTRSARATSRSSTLSGTSNGESASTPGRRLPRHRHRPRPRLSHRQRAADRRHPVQPLGGASAFTTDASLLLPTHTLGKSYLHLAWEQGNGAGSALVIVATEDNTNVTITADRRHPRRPQRHARPGRRRPRRDPRAQALRLHPGLLRTRT
jgi:hypothetical protein